MADHYRRPYLGAQSWISALSGEGPFADDLKEVLIAADRSELVIVISTLMPLEVLGGPHDDRTVEDEERVLLALSLGTVARVAANDRVVAEARTVRLQHRLNTMDALQLASAAAGRADVILTNDRRILSLRQYRGIPIAEPTWWGDVPLDFGSNDPPFS